VAGPPPDPDALSARAATGLRAPWFEVSCCPTNLSRTLASLGGYTATADDHGVRLELLTGAEIRTTLGGDRRIGLRVTTDYPWSGRVRVQITETDGAPWQLALRVPSWATGASLVVDGQPRAATPGQYAQADRSWRTGDEVILELPVAPRWTFPDPRIDAVRGTVAVERGPLVYCAESVDVSAGLELDHLAVDTSAPPADAPASPAAVDGPQAVTVPAIAAVGADLPGWPYALDRPPPAAGAARPIRLVPFYARANRGPATMRVFLPERKP
ncbi:MAG TPA: hypothetical protein VHW23_24635, partial [Kofleriaceae bacterium]|nr:hypothetical protein [Kofleriaceae bacterium]